jgi:hypothetical protein
VVCFTSHRTTEHHLGKSPKSACQWGVGIIIIIESSSPRGKFGLKKIQLEYVKKPARLELAELGNQGSQPDPITASTPPYLHPHECLLNPWLKIRLLFLRIVCPTGPIPIQIPIHIPIHPTSFMAQAGAP